MITQTDMRPASEGIETLEGLKRRLLEHVSAIETGINISREQWDGLKRLGCGRDDHAAEIMDKNLTQHLRNLQWFAERCVEQIESQVENPFGCE